MTTHSIVLAWVIPWTEESGGLQSIGSQKIGHEWSDLARRQRLLYLFRLLRVGAVSFFIDEVKWSESCSVVSDSLQPHAWNSPGQNAGVGSLSLLQGIFPTQGLNPGLPHCRRILYQLNHKGSPQVMRHGQKIEKKESELWSQLQGFRSQFMLIPQLAASCHLLVVEFMTVCIICNLSVS